MRRIIVGVITVIGIFFSTTVLSYEKDAYAQPISFGDFVKEMPLLLKKASAANNWVFSHEDKGPYQAQIDHKKYHIEVQFKVENNQIVIQLQSVTYRQKRHYADDAVQGWLLRLRKNIALGVTIAAKNDALRRWHLSAE